MSDFDDEDMPELTPASSPTLSATSDYDCREDDNFNEDANTSGAGNDKIKSQDNAIEISSSSSSSILSISENNPTTNHFNIQNDVLSTVTKDISCDPALLNKSFNINNKSMTISGPHNTNSIEPTKNPAVNVDQINKHMERVNLSGLKTPNLPSTVNVGANSMAISFEQKTTAQNTNRPSAIIRPNIHAPSTSKGTGFVTGRNRITSIKKHKRIRTAFSSQQLMGLEKEYSKTRYVDRNFRLHLANTLSLSEKTIKVWFQNRRMKEKKDKTEEESEDIPPTDSSKRIRNDNEGYQFPATINFNQGTKVCNTLHYSTTEAPIQPAVMNNPNNPQLTMNSSLIMPNYSIYIPNTQNYQPPLINQFYQMTNPQYQPFQHQQPYIQMQQPGFQPQHTRLQGHQLQYQQTSIQQMPVQQTLPQKYQEMVPKIESVIENSEENVELNKMWTNESH